MTVFVAHAPADREVAEELEKFLERRGHFVEGDDGSAALRPVQRADVLVLLLSKDFVFSPSRLRLEQRALDAWAEGRLLVVKLDHAFAPVGLRDLPALDASFAAQREFKWQELANAIRETLRAPAPADGPKEAGPLPKRQGRRGGWLRVLVLSLAAVPGLLAIAATVSIWLVNRIGPTPGTWDDLLFGIDHFGMRYGAPHGLTPWIFLITMLVTLAIFGASVAALVRRAAAPKRAAPSAPAPAPGAQEEPSPDALFVSYARANSSAVLPVIEAAKQEGRRFWLDQQSVVSGDSWAGEIVRAIRGAKGVLVMCSKAAFESDHVKREIYLADRYHKKLLPVFIEDAAPPEDFEYFFAGVQPLKLFETPEAERPQALMGVLGAA
ncbi:toll/interleukin-1 receptor domain-containing protein [Terricaulis sp.]|uniref:toll/interleukin-1 receptor domain-containing protein n=1 Tax=Terricaulis sp. TaxID=2768686 RepID=UPI0037850E50